MNGNNRRDDEHAAEIASQHRATEKDLLGRFLDTFSHRPGDPDEMERAIQDIRQRAGWKDAEETAMDSQWNTEDDVELLLSPFVNTFPNPASDADFAKWALNDIRRRVGVRLLESARPEREVPCVEKVVVPADKATGTPSVLAATVLKDFVSGDAATSEIEVAAVPEAPAETALPPEHILVGVRGNENDIIRKVRHFLAGVAAESRSHARRRMHDMLGELAERFSAGSAALFVQGDRELFVELALNMPDVNLTVPCDGPGIVSFVARTRRGYFSNNVHEDRHYRKDVPETKSELAAPAMTPDGKVLGVVNLESRYCGAFSAADIEELQAAASEFALHLLVLDALNQDSERWCPWHPGIHGWDLTHVSQRLCCAIADSIAPVSTKCTIWYADWPKDELFVYATNGYDYEYRFDRTLSTNSFTGRAARGSRGEIFGSRPADDPCFVRKEKARAMGIEKALSIPICSPKPGHREQGICALNIYFNHNQEVTPKLREAMVWLADMIETLCSNFGIHQQAAAVARLHHALYEKPLSSDSDFEGIQSVFSDVFAAPGCTILARPLEENKLYCVATTGLSVDAIYQKDDHKNATTPVGQEGEIVYDLDNDHGYTVFMAHHPGTCVRKNDLLNRSEKGLPADYPSRPLLRYREDFAPKDIDHRRLLGMAVGLRNDTLGVIRVIRPAKSKPFTMCDEHLFAKLAGQCKRVFFDWRLHRSKDQSQRVSRRQCCRGPFTAPTSVAQVIGRSTPSTTVAQALDRFLRPVPTLCSPRTLVGELMRDLFTIFRDRNILQSSLLVRHLFAETKPFRLNAYYSDHHKTPPGNAEYERLVSCPQTLAWENIIKEGKAVTFDNLQTAPVVAGIRMPVTAWCSHVLVEGIISLDFSQPMKWADPEINVLFHAAHRLAAIWGVTDPCGITEFAISPEIPNMNGRRTLRLLLDYIRQKHGIRWAELCLSDGSSLSRGQDFPEPPTQWSRLDPTTATEMFPFGLQDAASYGLKKRIDERAWSIPLRIGPSQVGEFRWNVNKDDSPERLLGLIGIITALWSNITFMKNGCWEVTFKSTEPQDTIRQWNPRFRWCKTARRGYPDRASNHAALLTYLSESP